VSRAAVVNGQGQFLLASSLFLVSTMPIKEVSGWGILPRWEYDRGPLFPVRPQILQFSSGVQAGRNSSHKGVLSAVCTKSHTTRLRWPDRPSQKVSSLNCAQQMREKL